MQEKEEAEEDKCWMKNLLQVTDGQNNSSTILRDIQTHTVKNENRKHPQPALCTGHALRAWGGLIQLIY